MVAHSIINVPITTRWQGTMLLMFAIGAFFGWRGGRAAISRFSQTRTWRRAPCWWCSRFTSSKSHRINIMMQMQKNGDSWPTVLVLGGTGRQNSTFRMYKKGQQSELQQRTVPETR